MVRQFLKLTALEFKVFLREPVAVFFNLFFPLMFLFLTMHVFYPKEAVNEGIINYYIPSFIIIIMTGVAFFNVPIYIVKYRNNKFLKRLRVAPISPLTILFSLGTANLMMLIFGLLLLVLIGLLFYGAEFSGNIFLLILGVLLSFASLGSIGLMIASFCGGMRTVNVISQVLYYPMLFLSGVIPIDIGWVKIVAKGVPITYGVDLVQRLWNEEYFRTLEGYSFQTSGILVDVLVLTFVLVVSMGIALKTWKWE